METWYFTFAYLIGVKNAVKKLRKRSIFSEWINTSTSTNRRIIEIFERILKSQYSLMKKSRCALAFHNERDLSPETWFWYLRHSRREPMASPANVGSITAHVKIINPHNLRRRVSMRWSSPVSHIPQVEELISFPEFDSNSVVKTRRPDEFRFDGDLTWLWEISVYAHSSSPNAEELASLMLLRNESGVFKLMENIAQSNQTFKWQRSDRLISQGSLKLDSTHKNSFSEWALAAPIGSSNSRP